MKTIDIEGYNYYLHEDGDTYNDYNIFYNVFTKQSNLKVFPMETIKELEKYYNFN